MNIFSRKKSIRLDGIYQLHHEVENKYGVLFKFTILLIFNKLNRVMQITDDGFSNVKKTEISGVLEEISKCTDTNHEFAEYFCKGEKIHFEFKSLHSGTEEYNGTITKDGLIITKTSHYWNEMAGKQVSMTELKEVNFKFIEA
jgi:hypothetical protein